MVSSLSKQEAYELLTKYAKYRGKVFTVLNEETNVSDGDYTYLLIQNDDGVLFDIDFLRANASDSAKVEVFKEVNVDTEGSTVPVTSTKGGTSVSDNVTARVGGAYSGLTDENKIDALRIQGSGQGANVVGSDAQESVAVIGESGSNVLVRMENVSGSVNDFQELKVKFTELNL